MRRSSHRLVVLLTLPAPMACGDDGGSDDGDEASDSDSDSGESDTGGPDYDIELLDRACPFEVPSDRSAECHTLRVPLRRDDPEAGVVELAVAVLHPPGGTVPSRGPVAVLHGGPGGSNFDNGPSWFARALSQDGDLVLFDQRGGGESLPNLDCPEVEQGWFAGFAETVDPLEEIAIMAEAVQQCHDRLAATVDLSAFSTSSNSDDVDDLRRALGYDRWSLYGVSYGTRLALETMRRHGEHIEFVILDSVYPPEVGGLDWAEAISLEAVPRVISGCLEEASCGAQFPGLEQSLVDAMAMLDAEPFLVETNDSQGTNHQLQLSGADMYAGLFNALYDPSVIPMVPLLIAIAGNGNFNFLNLVADGALPGLIGLSEGARYSMDCSDWGALAVPAAGALEASLAAHPELSTLYVGHSVPFCEAWDVEPAPPEFLEGVVSDLPTLVLAGEFDPVTPVAQSQQTASRLSQSAFYVFPGLGHAPSYNTDCAATMVRDFLVAGAVVDDGCWAAIPTTTFP